MELKTMHRILNAINFEDKNYRKTSPQLTQKLWKCLEAMDYQKSRRRFVKKLFLDNMCELESETNLKTIIDNAIDDKLIAEEVDPKLGFRLRPLTVRKDMNQINDWYCFECHTCAPNEELIGCKSCFRSFHEKCVESSPHTMDSTNQQSSDSLNTCSDDTRSGQQMYTNSMNELSGGTDDCTIFTSVHLPIKDLDYECCYCQRFRYPDTTSRAKQICGEELNLFIELFFKSIERKSMVDICSQYSIESSLSSYSLLFFPLDLKIIKRKVFELRNYISFVEFENDLRHFVHNFSIVGDKDLIKPLIDIIDKELQVLNECFDCYLWKRAPVEERVSSEEWFVNNICSPPHRLVYAKYKSHPYWPAKVVQWNEHTDESKVQFFEVRPQLFSIAVIPKDKIREMDYRMDSHILEKPAAVEALALLLRYLYNLRQTAHFIYGDTLKHLERVLTNKWNKFGYSFLKDFHFESNTNVNKKASKRKFANLKDSQDLNYNKRMQFNINTKKYCNYPLSYDTISCTSVGFEELEESTDSQMSPFKQMLADTHIEEEFKFKVCNLIIQYCIDSMSKESEESQE